MKTHPIWSATPTPFLSNFQLDVPSVGRVMERHRQLGVDGVMLLGTCGEGPQIPNAQRKQLVEEAVAAANGMQVAVQCTDNSLPRVLDQMEMAAKAGAGFAVIAPPDTPSRLLRTQPARFYLEIFERSPLPVIFYDRGKSVAVPVTAEVIREILVHPKVKLLKDSTGDLDRARTLLAVKGVNPELQLLNGNEFMVPDFLEAGYDGVMLGGSILNARYIQEIVRCWHAGDQAGVEKIDQRMQSMLYAVYGGEKIACWLAGLKHTLVRLGTFTTTANYPGYELTDACAAAIEEVLLRDRDFLTVSP
jgi:Dihydrodipicolinate synthase/N-acetylneuraminate lyase